MTDPGKIDPLELARLKLQGELSADDIRKLKLQARQAKAAQVVPKGSRRLEDPIEAQRRKLQAQMERRRQRTESLGRAATPPGAPVPAHLVVVVRPAAPASPKPAAAKPRNLEDEITRRLAEARRKLES